MYANREAFLSYMKLSVHLVFEKGYNVQQFRRISSLPFLLPGLVRRHIQHAAHYHYRKDGPE